MRWEQDSIIYVHQVNLPNSKLDSPFPVDRFHLENPSTLTCCCGSCSFLARQISSRPQKQIWADQRSIKIWHIDSKTCGTLPHKCHPIFHQSFNHTKSHKSSCPIYGLTNSQRVSKSIGLKHHQTSNIKHQTSIQCQTLKIENFLQETRSCATMLASPAPKRFSNATAASAIAIHVDLGRNRTAKGMCGTSMVRGPSNA